MLADEVAQHWFASYEPDDVRNKAIWRIEIQHAIRVSELGWHHLRELPADLIAIGVIDAASGSFEIVPANELD